MPKFFSVLIGKMALVGPRPLSIIHAERDIQQGNFVRRKLRGGIIGLGHVRKGTEEFGSPEFEFEYAGVLAENKCLQTLKTDIWVVWTAMKLVLKGGGH